jgi:hypothetical protein
VVQTLEGAIHLFHTIESSGINLLAAWRVFFNNNEMLFLTAYYRGRMKLRDCIIYSKRHFSVTFSFYDTPKTVLLEQAPE